MPVAVACRVTAARPKGITNGSRTRSPSGTGTTHLINAALEIHAEDPGYGDRFVADELADMGFTACENRVWGLCSTQRIFSLHSKKRGHNRKPGPPVHDDLLKVIDAVKTEEAAKRLGVRVRPTQRLRFRSRWV